MQFAEIQNLVDVTAHNVSPDDIPLNVFEYFGMASNNADSLPSFMPEMLQMKEVEPGSKLRYSHMHNDPRFWGFPASLSQSRKV